MHIYVSFTLQSCAKSEGLHWMQIKELLNAYYLCTSFAGLGPWKTQLFL